MVFASQPGRYEFRIFSNDLGPPQQALEQQALRGETHQAEDTYILTLEAERNFKLRDGQLDIKMLMERHRGLERWRPLQRIPFPLSNERLTGEVFALLQVATPHLGRGEYTLDNFLREVVAPHPDLSQVTVRKERTSFRFGECRAEFATLLIGERHLQTLAVEGDAPEAVLDGLYRLGLRVQDNTSYPRALQRLTNLIGQPL